LHANVALVVTGLVTAIHAIHAILGTHAIRETLETLARIPIARSASIATILDIGPEIAPNRGTQASATIAAEQAIKCAIALSHDAADRVLEAETADAVEVAVDLLVAIVEVAVARAAKTRKSADLAPDRLVVIDRNRVIRIADEVAALSRRRKKRSHRRQPVMHRCPKARKRMARLLLARLDEIDDSRLLGNARTSFPNGCKVSQELAAAYLGRSSKCCDSDCVSA